MIDFSTILPQLTPDVQIETDWTSGLNAVPADKKTLMLLGYKTSSGTATVGVPTQLTSLVQAQTLFGVGSDLATMAEKALAICPRNPIYGCAYAEGAGTAATAAVVFTGTATGNGSFNVTIGGRYFAIGIATGNTPTNMGDALAAAINAATNAPFTAVNTTGSVAVTARQKGTGGNSIKLHGTTLAPAASVTVVIPTTLATGATDGVPTTALAGLESSRYHIMALNASNAVAIASFKADREKQSGVAIKKWGIGVVPFAGTLADAITQAGTTNSYRIQIVWMKSGDMPEAELSAAFAALRASKQANVSLDDVVVPGIDPAADKSIWPNVSDIESALAAGLVPLRPLLDGTCQCVRSVVSKHGVAASYIDHMPLEISDYADEYLIDLFEKRIKGKRLKTGSKPGSPLTITPQRATALMNLALYKLDEMDYIQGVADAVKAGLNFSEVNGTDPNRLDMAWKYWPIAFAHFVAVKKTYGVE